MLALIREWYNGYSWDGKHFLYNPFSILSFFDSGDVSQNFWFSTGTPTFLIQFVADIEEFLVKLGQAQKWGKVAFESFDIENI